MRNMALTLMLAVAPGYALASTVSVFDLSPYVNTGSPSQESDQMQQAAASLGHTVNTFTGFAAADWDNAFSGGSVVLIPELRENLPGAMDAAARTALADNVNAGGGLVLAGPTDYTSSLLDTLFGWSLSSAFATIWPDPSTLNGVNAAGTHFADDPVSITGNNRTSGYITALLPSGAVSIYQSGVDTSVFTIGVGTGSVTVLAWDWFSALPSPGIQDGGWNQVLDSALAHAAKEPVRSSSVPEPGVALLFGVALISLAASRCNRKSA